MNNGALMNSEFIGPAVTVDSFRMYDAGQFPYVSDLDPAYPVHGELYNVGEYVWELIEQIEGYPNHYDRAEIQVRVGDDVHDASMYCVHRTPGLPELTNGKWHGGIKIHEGYYANADGTIHGPFGSADEAVREVKIFTEMIVGRLLTHGRSDS